MMIAYTPENGWSELLTSVPGAKSGICRVSPRRSKFWWIVSNPAQHRCPRRVMVDLQKIQSGNHSSIGIGWPSDGGPFPCGQKEWK